MNDHLPGLGSPLEQPLAPPPSSAPRRQPLQDADAAVVRQGLARARAAPVDDAMTSVEIICHWENPQEGITFATVGAGFSGAESPPQPKLVCAAAHPAPIASTVISTGGRLFEDW